jgi:hypothetical protein
MEWLVDFWSRNSDPILIGIAIALGAAILSVVLLRAWRVLLWTLQGVWAILYWLLIGWWFNKIRRAVTGNPW